MASQVDTQYSKFGNVIRNIKNKLGNRSLKSDLKSTVMTIFQKTLTRYTSQIRDRPVLNTILTQTLSETICNLDHGSVYGSSDYKNQSELYTHPLHCVLLSPIEWLHEVQRLVNFTIFSTTPQFFRSIETEIGDTKKNNQ